MFEFIIIEVIILAFALSMDAFAVSLSLGAKHKLSLKGLAIKAALYFGFFQGAMPLIGYLGGRELLGLVAGYSHFIAFALLIVIGGHMIYESLNHDDEEQEETKALTHFVMFTLAIATSIDAMAAGFTLNLIQLNAYLACIIIGVLTALMSFLGVYIGVKTGDKLKQKAELAGGVVLILIGIKMVLI
ncbi:manganese efflux pump MntP [Algibacillus agarilyticus]|uniref:manganese efflux pump MntP n=1 Tax=Algibacillus agarilyticus TaxID=2234133 RepID=UPI001E35C472|nr:manganese efflux pump MntP family protein [Algibacillus agarilyticus]